MKSRETGGKIPSERYNLHTLLRLRETWEGSRGPLIQRDNPPLAG